MGELIKEKARETWRDLGIKDKIQYVTACALIASGIAAAFVCILCNLFTIPTGVLIYIAQAFITAGGIFGVSIYFKSKLGEFDTRQNQRFENAVDELAKKLAEDWRAASEGRTEGSK